MALQGTLGRGDSDAGSGMAIQTMRQAGVLTLIQQWQAFFELLILVVWLGAMLFFSFGVAQSAFSALPTKHLAALVVTSTLSKVELIGLVSGPLLIILFIVGRRALGTAAAFVPRVVLVLAMTSAAALSHFLVTPTMVTIRDSLPDAIDLVSATVPARMRFDHLHQYSVGLMSAAMLAGLILLFMTVQAWIKPRSTQKAL